MSPTEIPVEALRLTMGDIAAACGVDRSTVTRWRQTRREAPFPTPRLKEARSEADEFALGDMLAWLTETRPDDALTVAHLHPYAFARELERRHPAEPLLTTVCQLLENPQSTGHHAWTGSHLAALDEHDLLERLLDLRPALTTTWPAEDPIRPEVLALISGLTDPGEGQIVIHDPGAADGDLLAAVVRGVAERAFAQVSLIVVAHEADPGRQLLLKRRLAALGRRFTSDTRWSFKVASTGPDTALRGPVDRLVAQLPLAADPRSIIAELDRLLKRVTRGGQLVVLGPRDALIGDLPVDSEVGWRRAQLLRTNGPEFLVDLPGAVKGPSDRAAAILVLRRAQKNEKAVVVDLRQGTLTLDRVHSLLPDVRARATRARIQVTAQEDLLASDYRMALNPTEPVTAPEDLLTILRQVKDLQNCAENLATLQASDRTTQTRRIPIGSRRRGPDADLALVVPGKNPERTRMGDVVVTFSEGNLTSARVDHEGDALVHRPNQIVRLTEIGHEQWTPRVLAALIAWRIGRGASGSLDSVSITPPAPEYLHAWDQALAALEEYRLRLDERAAALADLENAMTHHLFTGQSEPVWEQKVVD